MGIVRAMKQPRVRLLQSAYGACVLLAAAPLAGAQNVATAPPKSAAAMPASAPPAAAPPAATPAPAETISNEQASYLFGLTFGEQLRGIGITNQVLPDALDRGLKEGLQGRKSTTAERQQVQEFARSMMMSLAEHNKTAAQEFLAKNEHEKGVKTTASGLQYKVLIPGDAKTPLVTASDEVTVNYRGKLLDGSEFDSSYARGQPVSFPVGGVIKGWQEALVLMKPGAKWQLFIPPDLAYGASPKPGIPPNSLLVFDVELMSVKEKPAAGQAGSPQAAPPHKAPGGTPPAATPQ
jgi:FKBP-type peptidyl-prolyl cis-trans isomerase